MIRVELQQAVGASPDDVKTSSIAITSGVENYDDDEDVDGDDDDDEATSLRRQNGHLMRATTIRRSND